MVCQQNLNFLSKCPHALPSPVRSNLLNLSRASPLLTHAHTNSRLYRRTHSRCVGAFGSCCFTLKIRQDTNHKTCQSYILVRGLQTALHADKEREHFQHVDGIKLLFLTSQTWISSCSTCLLYLERHVNTCSVVCLVCHECFCLDFDLHEFTGIHARWLWTCLY